MIDPIDKKSSGYYLFGQDVFHIPCFRNSFLYGLSASVGTSLVTFLFTSNGTKSFNFAFGALMFTAFPYMIYCQEKHYTTMLQIKEVEDRVKNVTNESLTITDSLMADDLRPDATI